MTGIGSVSDYNHMVSSLTPNQHKKALPVSYQAGLFCG